MQEVTKESRVHTGVKEFIGFVRSLPYPSQIIIEEGVFNEFDVKKGDLKKAMYNNIDSLAMIVTIF